MLQTRPRPDLAAQTRLFRVLGDPSRLALLELLRGGELPRGFGVLESRQSWRHVVYRLASSSTAGLLEEADRVLMEVADSMAACTRPEMTARLANRA